MSESLRPRPESALSTPPAQTAQAATASSRTPSFSNTTAIVPAWLLGEQPVLLLLCWCCWSLTQPPGKVPILMQGRNGRIASLASPIRTGLKAQCPLWSLPLWGIGIAFRVASTIASSSCSRLPSWRHARRRVSLCTKRGSMLASTDSLRTSATARRWAAQTIAWACTFFIRSSSALSRACCRCPA